MRASALFAVQFRDGGRAHRRTEVAQDIFAVPDHAKFSGVINFAAMQDAGTKTGHLVCPSGGVLKLRGHSRMSALVKPGFLRWGIGLEIQRRLSRRDEITDKRWRFAVTNDGKFRRGRGFCSSNNSCCK